MKETLPMSDKDSGYRPNDPEDAKTVLAGSGEPHEARMPSPPPPLARPATPPSPPPFQRVPTPSANEGRTVMMTAPQPQIPLAWLGVVSGPGVERGRTFVLLLETIVGRTAGDMLLNGDSTVSSQHAKLRLEPKEGGAEDEQVFVIYDLASSNGTYVGTREHYKDDDSRTYRRELHNGDYILLGETTLVFWQA